MAAVRVLLSFSLLCWAFHLVVNQIDATREVKTLNYPIKKQRIRIRRDKIVVDSCSENDIIDTVHGFSQLTEKDCNVQFIKDNGKYSMKVTWETPIGRNNSSPVGYWFWWLVYRDTNFQSSSSGCTFLSAKNTSFVVHVSEHWRKHEDIAFLIYPLPRNHTGSILFNLEFTPTFTDLNPSTRMSTPSTTSTGTTTFTESTNSDRSSRASRKIITLASEKKQSKEKETFTIVTVAIATAAAVSLLGFILARHTCRKRKPRPPPIVHRDPDYIYVSYISESESHTEKVVDFSSWLRKHGYNVQMDIMSTPSNQEDLKELGRLRWGEKQLLNAKNVFIIVSPSYLNLCRLDEGKTDASSLTQEETIIYSEITQICNELSSTAYISSRFIPVLFGVKGTELPFWIKQLVVYNWPDDRMNNKLLYRINEEVSYDNGDITDTSNDTSA